MSETANPNDDAGRRYLMVLRCDDRPGIVHEITSALLRLGANIIESAQFSDPGSNTFVMRTRFVTVERDTGHVESILRAAALPDGFEIRVRAEDQPLRAMVLVSRQDHCLVDLLYRHRAGELGVEIATIVSNHLDCEPHARNAGIPYVHMPITPENKLEQEARLLTMIDEQRIDLVVLARYMQVLTDETAHALRGRAINIHHSFLPGFKGAKPYHQAHRRGVKLIGATAHYVTGDLDEGPIIEQDVIRVTHAHVAEDFVRIGRDIERSVLSRAVQAHGEERVILIGDRTVVFA